MAKLVGTMTMLGATRWMFGGLQIAAAIVALAAIARAQIPRDLDRSGLGQLLSDSTRYLDPQTTGSLTRLIERR